MTRSITFLLITAMVSGCAAVPPANALVGNAAAAIQIGEKACNAKGVLIPMRGRAWTARYSAGIWAVELPARFPDVLPGWSVEVDAMTGKPGSCEVFAPLEQVV